MGFFVGFLLEFSGDLGVDGGGGKVCVAKNLLDGFEVHAVFKEMGGYCVSQGVWG